MFCYTRHPIRPGQTQNLRPPSKKFLKNDIEMSSIQLCVKLYRVAYMYILRLLR